MYEESLLINAVKFLKSKIHKVDENSLRSCIFTADRFHIRMYGRTITRKEFDKKFLTLDSAIYTLEEDISLLDMANSKGEVDMDCFSTTDVEALYYAISLVNSFEPKDLQLVGMNGYHDNQRLNVEINAEDLFEVGGIEYQCVDNLRLELNKEEHIAIRDFHSFFAFPKRYAGSLFISHKKELRNE
jgi:hypothetical protein